MYYILAMHRHFILPTEDHVCVIRVNSSVLKLIQRRKKIAPKVRNYKRFIFCSCPAKGIN